MLVVPECKGKEDILRMKLTTLGLKSAFAMRKRSKLTCPGGGVCIIVRESTRMEVMEFDSRGLLWVRVTPRGRNPINVIGAYIPTANSPVTLDNPRIRDQLMHAHAGMVARAEGTGIPWVALGDYNLSLGSPKGWGRLAEVQPKRPDSARDIAITWGNTFDARTPAGSSGEPAKHTCFVPNASNGGPLSGMSEPDLVWTKITANAKPLKLDRHPEASGDPWGQKHRMIGVEIEVPPPKERMPQRKRGEGKPRLQPPEYGDREAREQWSEDLAERIPRMREITGSEASLEEKLAAMVEPMQGVARDHYTRVRELPRNKVRKLYQGKDVPPEAAILFEQSRGILRSTKGASRGAAVYLRQVARRARMRGAAIANNHFEATLGRAAASLLKSDSAAFHRIMKDGAAAGGSPDALQIPPKEDGTPAHVAFLQEARDLYVEKRSDEDVPALQNRDFWLPHLRKEGNPERLHSLLREATPQEMAGVLFRGGVGAAGVCNANACVRCRKAAAQAESAQERPMGRQKKRLRTNKAWGADDIPAELISWMIEFDYDTDEKSKEMLAEAFANIYNSMLAEGRAPEGFADAILTPLLKPTKNGVAPDAKAFASYRLISLIGIVNKVLMLFLVDRISHALDLCGSFGPEQAGFMFGQSTEDAHFWQTHAARRAPKEGEPLYTLWIDIKRAYDNVHLGALAFVLSGVGIPEAVVNLIISMISGGRGTLRVNGIESEPFVLNKGVPQGNPLSCLLFAIFIASLPRYLNSIPELEGHVILGARQKIQLYADDGASTCRGRAQAELLLQAIRFWAKEWSLELNCKDGKTEFSLFGSPSPADRAPLRPSAAAVEADPALNQAADVNNAVVYKYLGAGVNSEDPTWEDPALAHLKRVWGNYDALRFSSTLLSSLPVAQQLQIRDTYTPLHLGAFHPIVGPSMKEAERKSLNSLEDIFGVQRTKRRASGKAYSSGSHLLTYTAMGADHPIGTALSDRFRKLQTYLAHPSRQSANELPTCVALFDALAEEYETLFKSTSRKERKDLPYNWVTETVTLLQGWTDALPEAPFAPIVEWTHELKQYTGNARSAISYLKLKRENKRVLTGEFRVFDRRPRTDGGTRHARFLTGDMCVPNDVLRQPEGIPLSYMGPGLRNPLTLANGGGTHLYRVLMVALQGRAALQRWPFNPDATEPKAFDPEDDPIEEGFHNWSSSAPCRLCAEEDANCIYHLAFECTHPAMAERRERLRSSMANHAIRIKDDLFKVQQAYRGAQEAEYRATAEECEDFDAFTANLRQGNAPPVGTAHELEANIYCYRLLLAAPWARSNAAEGQHFAAALGAAFDMATPQHASPRMLRPLSARMCGWGDRQLRKIADAYRMALTPTQPLAPESEDLAQPPALTIEDGSAQPAPLATTQA